MIQVITFIAILGFIGLLFGGKRGALFALRAGVALVILAFAIMVVWVLAHD